MILGHFVGCVEEPQHCLAIIHPREKDHELNIDRDQVEIQGAELEVDGYVQRDLAGVNRGQQL